MLPSSSKKIKMGAVYALFIPALLLIIYGLNLLFPLNLMRYRDVSTIVLSQNEEPLFVFQSQDDKWRLATDFKEVDTLYLNTLLAREDRYFWHHPGVNPFSILRAAYQWICHGHVVSGASTITMQTARLLEPRPRKIGAKVIECLRALQLEWAFSKQEILNMYLTLAPFGRNIEGTKAASWAYFKKYPTHLSPAEVALLVALPQSPTRLSPTNNPSVSKKARQNILSFMEKNKIISNLDAKYADAEPLISHTGEFPRAVPHLARRLKFDYPGQSRFHTTIDMSLQRQIEHVLKSYSRFMPDGVNAAILIFDHTNNKPVVYIGSRGFFDSSNSGQVDYICAYRSPGSTLKPFIYGLAFDYGFIQPDSLILDDQHRFGSYMPGNFDKDINGVITVKDALSRSLNIPVVRLLSEIGPIRFLGALKEVNINPKFGSNLDRPSLAIALGGLGMQLEQLVMLYSGLARGGKIKQLSYLNTNQKMSEQNLLSRHAAEEITNILQDDHDAYAYEDRPRPSIKTGTSYGYRDTLALGYDNSYVVGVWIGFPDGSSMGPVSARILAAPLVRKIFKVLPVSHHKPSYHLENKTALKLKNLQNASVHYQESLHKDKPHLLFPVNDSVLDLQDDGGIFKPVPLTVTGGKKPYTWMIDGQPLTTQAWHQKQLWTPEKPGFYKVSVMDAQGEVKQANVEVRRDLLYHELAAD